MLGTRRRWLAPVLGAAAVFVLAAAACEPAVEPIAPTLQAGILTSEGGDRYGLTVADGVVTASAPTSNQGGNTRVAFWQAADEWSVDQETCSTWVDARSTLQQQGATLRVRSGNGRTTAITVTNNIYFLGRWIFNVHVMDSAAAQPFHQIGSFDLSEVFRPGGPDTYTVPPYPWRMCARAVGDTVSFIVWPLTHEEPSWDDPRYGGSVTLPAAWGRAGYPGWYVGHLEPGDSVGFRDLTTAAISPQAITPNRAQTEAQSEADAVAPEPTTPPREPTWIPRAP
jgi:hypothetical protein